MGEAPLITPYELRREAAVAMETDVYLAGVLRRAARALEFKDAQLAELRARIAVLEGWMDTASRWRLARADVDAYDLDDCEDDLAVAVGDYQFDQAQRQLAATEHQEEA